MRLGFSAQVIGCLYKSSLKISAQNYCNGPITILKQRYWARVLKRTRYTVDYLEANTTHPLNAKDYDFIGYYLLEIYII